VVHLQAGQWNEARAALEKAVELRGQEDGVNLLALALVHHRLGDVETAKKYRERFLKWVQENAKHPFMGSDPLLRRLAPQVSLALGQPIQLPRPGPNPFPGKPIIPRPPMPPGGTTVPK
jgi:tetratricopeptide (TPR) repeat protein